MDEIKLKPCPFCGGRAELLNESNCLIYVKCTVCRAETGGVHVQADYCANDKAAEAWNRRTPQTVRCGDCINCQPFSGDYADVLICTLTHERTTPDRACGNGKERPA